MADSFSGGGGGTLGAVDDMSCFTVDDTSFDYDYDSLASITNTSQCNCSIALHAYLEPCFDVCEYPEAPLPPVEEVLFPAVVYALVFLLGTIGNGLVIFVVNRFRRMRNVTNLFLASLSTADLCLIWLCVPIMVSLRFLTLTLSLSLLILFSRSLASSSSSSSSLAADCVRFSGSSAHKSSREQASKFICVWQCVSAM